MTLIELLVTLMVASIVFFMGVPMLSQITNQVNFGSTQRSLIANLFFARAKAVTQGYSVTVCASQDGQSCSLDLNDWSTGWIIFHDSDEDGVYFPEMDQLVRSNSVNNTVAISWSGTGHVVFDGDGTVQEGGQGVLKICDVRGDFSTAKGVSISLSGRVYANDAVSCNENENENENE